MKSIKLLACLVTLQFIGGLTLTATEPNEFRQWSDPSGRSITARLVELIDTDSITIQRQDGSVFTVSLKMFSTADQDYVHRYRAQRSYAEASENGSSGALLKEPEPSTWTLLNQGGNQPASQYNNTQLDLILDAINQRFALKAVKTSIDLPLKVRTEPSGLASRIKFSGDMPRMSMESFVREVARINGLDVKTDLGGMVVLVDKQPTASFLGVLVSTR